MGNRLKELRERLLGGEIGKSGYIEQMYLCHRLLFEYADYLPGTGISAIEIKDGEIIMTARESGMKLFCPPNDERTAPIETLNFLQYEPKADAMICRLLEPGYHVFDIGANIGWYSLRLAKACPDIKVFAFEPIEKTYRFLRRNIELNRLDNIEIFNFGFWKSEDALLFHFYPQLTGAASIADILEQDGLVTVSCPVKKLDDFCREKDLTVDFIKCDVEGAELFVYQGGLETIKRQRPIIFSEMLRKWAAKFNYHPNDIIALLRPAGYQCFMSQGGGLAEFETMDDETLETNFFFLHREKHAEKIRRFSGGFPGGPQQRLENR
jgi:FkbM family methyltransferase